MPRPTTAEIRAIIDTRKLKWEARELPSDFKPRGLGWEPAPAERNREALANGQRLMLTRMPMLFSEESMRSPLLQPLSPPETTLATGRPRKFDWRNRGVIGPVTDQLFCGSCVSFAACGLVASMAAIEQGIAPPDLSEADSHFNSSHGAHCSGWNNNDALNQIRTRGVAPEGDCGYMAAFDSPPQPDPTLPVNGDHLWQAHVRAIADRNQKIYKLTEITAWTGNSRKTYIANVGPLICGYTVYEDFDAYNGGVYSHTTGNVRGGHAVLVVGYDDDDNCWICRNSWGPSFGGAARADGTGAGFFKIAYGDSNIDGEAFYGCQGVIAPASLKWGGLVVGGRGDSRAEFQCLWDFTQPRSSRYRCTRKRSGHLHCSLGAQLHRRLAWLVAHSGRHHRPEQLDHPAQPQP